MVNALLWSISVGGGAEDLEVKSESVEQAGSSKASFLLVLRRMKAQGAGRSDFDGCGVQVSNHD